ncbi:MAG: adenylyltransferase/cytidyltransferase family protein [bacterium]|nr:adenylyltransferase/cytidyltransferase family protein [bacterium]
MQNLEKNALFQTLFYARTFQQELSVVQLWQRLFLGQNRFTKKEFAAQLQQMLAQGILLQKEQQIFYLPRQKSVNNSKIWQEKYSLAQKAAQEIQKLPFVWAVGLTGSLAAHNCQGDDDLDFLIITAPKRVYWARFFCYFLAWLKHKKHHLYKVNNSWCFNVFLSADQLLIPFRKRTLYGACQLKMLQPLVDPQNLFKQLLAQNLWLDSFFNQAIAPFETVCPNFKATKFGDWSESLMRKMQLNYMKGKITREIVTEKQIFFHPLQRKIASLAQLEQFLQQSFQKQQVSSSLVLPQALQEKIKNNSGEIALITGVFDLLHTQHQRFIREALLQTSGLLLIGLESDKRVKAMKGEKRPFYNQNERLLRLQNLFPQVEVFILPDNFKQKVVRERLLRKLCVNKLFIGDRDSHLVDKHALAEKNQISLITIKEKPQISMTKILQQKKLQKELLFAYDREQLKKVEQNG